MIALSLAAVSAAIGWVALWIFRKTVDLAKVRSSIKRIHAHLLEFRLFYDDPPLIWRAQKSILRENLRFCLLMARPALMLTLPLAWLLVQMDTVYGYAPLRIGEPSVVTAQVAGQLGPEDAVALEAPPEISVETPPIRSLADRQISWRIRALGPVRGSLRLVFRGVPVDKSIAAGTRSIFLVRKRVHSPTQFLLRPEEARLPAGEIAWVEVDYPETGIGIAGIGLPWIAWFVLISAGAVVLARWFRISP